MVTKHKITVCFHWIILLGTIWEMSLNSEVTLFQVLHFRQGVLCRGVLTTYYPLSLPSLSLSLQCKIVFYLAVLVVRERPNRPPQVIRLYPLFTVS